MLFNQHVRFSSWKIIRCYKCPPAILYSMYNHILDILFCKSSRHRSGLLFSCVLYYTRTIIDGSTLNLVAYEATFFDLSLCSTSLAKACCSAFVGIGTTRFIISAFEIFACRTPCPAPVSNAFTSSLESSAVTYSGRTESFNVSFAFL